MAEDDYEPVYYTPPPSITREQLLSGNVAGIHQLEKPLKVFKQVACDCSHGWENISSIATLELPKGVWVVRPGEYSAEDKIRSDKAIVKSIKFNGLSLFPSFFFSRILNCQCRSVWDKTFKYPYGGTVVPTDGFDPSIRNTCSRGLHSFLEKSKAEEYSSAFRGDYYTKRFMSDHH